MTRQQPSLLRAVFHNVGGFMGFCVAWAAVFWFFALVIILIIWAVSGFDVGGGGERGGYDASWWHER